MSQRQKGMPESTHPFFELWGIIAAQFALGAESIHGPWHWSRVENNGLMIAEHSGADIEIVRLFAVLHDSCRLDEGSDIGHGQRGAELAVKLYGNSFTLDDSRMNTLCEACAGHELGNMSTDPTIGTCWDADRLDLPRVGTRPMATLMSTTIGKQLASR